MGCGKKKKKLRKMRIQKKSIKGEDNEEDLTPKAYQSLRAQILCNTQGGIQSLLSQRNILPIPNPTLEANDMPYMISFQMFSH